MKKTPIGHIVCPVCEHPDAEVKEDKNAHAYIHCTDCNAQVFTRNAHRDTHLRKRMRPVTVTVTEPTVTVAPSVPVTVPISPIKKPVPVPAPKPAVKKSKAWFQPLMAGGYDGEE
jgi:hypothetical protein